MFIGVPKEIKDHEYRVSISPAGVRELIHHGHNVIVQTNAGYGIGYDDNMYSDAGAYIADTAHEVYSKSELIVKVKEPLLEECRMIREGQVVFCYLHLAADATIAEALINSGCIAIAYETVTDTDDSLPLLAPMSEIAGRLATQAGASCLERVRGGRGVLLGGATGVDKGNVTVLGGGVVGYHAANIALGLGANVTILEKNIKRINYLDQIFKNRVNILYSTVDSVEENILKSDLLIGGVLIPGAAAPKIVSEDLVSRMKRGAVIVDVAIDQGGCVATSKATNFSDPIYEKHEVVHYCVTNMPSAVARTSTCALENATLPYILNLANNGYREALRENKGFAAGLNIYRGKVVHESVARELNHSYVPNSTFLNNR